jgi:uncharacterized membrane protein
MNRNPQHKSKTNSQRSDKRTQFLSREPRKKKVAPLLTAGAILAVAFLLYIGLNSSSGASSATSAEKIASSSTGLLTVPISLLDGGKAKFFEYMSRNNKPMRFFVLRSSDGVYRAALDTCDVCYRAKRGYVQSGDSMVCRKCGRDFPSNLVNEVSGDCNPVGIPGMVAEDRFVIQAGELDKRAQYF